MKKKKTYIIEILALGIVIFNNMNQITQSLSQNRELFIGFLMAMIASIVYGIINLN